MCMYVYIYMCFPLPCVRTHPAGSEAHTIVICNAILNSEVMTDEQTEAMVDRLAEHMKRGLGEM